MDLTKSMSNTTHSFFSVCNPGLAKLSLQEATEISNTKAQLVREAAIFSVDISCAVELFRKNQSFTYLSLLLCKCSKVEEFSLRKELVSKNLFGAAATFSVEVKGVKGQENRIEVAKRFYQAFSDEVTSGNIPQLELDHKKPDVQFLIYDTQEGYLVGLQLNREDFSSRKFRVFAHQASFKGDFAYNIVRESGVTPDDSLLVMFARDGAIAIEAALFLNKLPVRKVSRKDFISSIPLFKGVLGKEYGPLDQTRRVTSFDSRLGNIRAHRNNAKIAGALEYLNTSKCAVDDVDTRFEKEMFSKAIVHLTRRDEHELNDVYYQLKYVLQKGGKVLFVTRLGFEMVVPESFSKIFQKTVMRGKSEYGFILLEKKN